MREGLYRIQDVVQLTLLSVLLLGVSYLLSIEIEVGEKMSSALVDIIRQLSKVRYISVTILSALIVFDLYKICTEAQKEIKIRLTVGDSPPKMVSRFFNQGATILLVANILVLREKLQFIFQFELVVFSNLLILFYILCGCLFIRSIIARQL